VAIRDWHPGQLAVLWIGGFFAAWVAYQFNIGGSRSVKWVTAFAFLVAIPVGLLVITWKWFGGRRGR
jgi:hypothetical protein